MPHTHQYILTNIASHGRPKYLVYKCANCPHYVPLIQALGRKQLCWECGKEIQVSQYHVSRKVVRPKCRPACKEKVPEFVPLPAEFLNGAD